MLTMQCVQPSTEIKITIAEEDTLTLAFAKFVRMCEIIGYQDGSWEDLLTKIGRRNFKDLSWWALETILAEEG